MPEHLLSKIKVMFSVFDVDSSRLIPSGAVADKMDAIMEQLLIMFQYEHMINERKEDLDLFVEKEMQLKEVVHAQSYDHKK